MINEITDQSVFFLTFLKYMKVFYTNNWKLIFNLSYLDISEDLEKDL